MKTIIRTAIKYKKITLMVLAILLLMGVYSYYIMPRQEFPEINAPVALVTVQYPGASPEDIESLVTSKVEERLEALDGYDYSNSKSLNSFSVSVVRLTVDADIDKTWADLRQEMNDLQSELPNQAEEIDVNTDVVRTAGILVSISSQEFDYETLESYAKELEMNLKKVEGLSTIDIVGIQEKEVKVTVDYKKLNQFNLSMNEILQLIESNSVEIPSGSVEEDGKSVIIKTEGSFVDLEEIRNLTIAISRENGSIAKLGDIATIEYGVEDSNYKIRHNGENAILLVGYFKENENIVLIGDQIEKMIDDFGKNIPESVQFSKISFQPTNVDQAIRNFSMNLLQGIIFVIIVVLIGMGFRNAIIVSLAIPSTILITFNMMNLLGFKLHQISIAALIVALGMLVDNAIVINDSIQVKLDEGMDKLQACVLGTREVAIPVFTSTLTTIAAFLPLLMLPSVAGEYIKSLPSIIMISLLISYMIAIIITPTISFIFLKEIKKEQKKSRIRKIFNQMLKFSLNHRKTVALAIIVLIVITVNVALAIGLQFFPYADTDLIYLDVNNDESGSIDSTEEIINSVEEVLASDQYVIDYTTAIGNGLPKFYNTMPLPSPSDSYGQLVVKVAVDEAFEDGLPFEKYLEDLQNRLDRNVINGQVVVNRIEQGEPIGHPVRVRVLGENIDELNRVATELKNMLDEMNGTVNIGDDFLDQRYQFKIDIDDDYASILGLTKYDLQNEVSLALRGRSTSVLRTEGKEYNIQVKSNIEKKDDLENLLIKSSMSGNKVLLKDVATMKLISEYPEITKFNAEKSILVYSDVRPGYSSVEIERQLGNLIEASNDFRNVDIIFDGEREKIIENFGNVTISAIFAIVLVFLILLFQFKSYLRTLVILFTIPLSTIGSILGLYVFNQKLSFLAFLGIVSLLGIVVNNAIVLVDFIDSERNDGKAIKEACLGAVEKRFRPIILTTATTVIGLLPLVYSRSVMFMPLAVALLSGLLVSTVLTLVIIPTVYYQVLNHECKSDPLEPLKNQLSSLK